MAISILANLKRCTGCWSCSMGCKTGNDTPDGVWWQVVRTLGSGAGIDDPAGTWPDLSMSWMPVWTKNCVKCPTRIADGEKPYCEMSCPTHAIISGDLNDPDSAISKEKAALEEKGYRVYQLPVWENAKDGIYYADI